MNPDGLRLERERSQVYLFSCRGAVAAGLSLLPNYCITLVVILTSAG